MAHGTSFKYNLHTILTHAHVTLKKSFLFNSDHPVAIPARSFDFLLCDHTKTFTLDVNIPNITFWWVR